MSKIETFLRKILTFLEKVESILMDCLKSIGKIIEGGI